LCLLNLFIKIIVLFKQTIIEIETQIKYAYEFCKSCEQCKKIGGLSHRHEMLQTPMLYCETSNVWGMDFMGPLPSSFGFIYILLVVDYVSK
jgi:hypothetical protein